MTREEKLAEFVAWVDKNITGDEKGQAQIFLDRLFQGREVRRVRAEALKNIKGGLRALYRTLELPGTNPLKENLCTRNDLKVAHILYFANE